MEIKPTELAEMIGCKVTSPVASRGMGQNIVVLDRGFVYVGNVTIEGDFVRVTEAKNIRYWGTKNGSGSGDGSGSGYG